MSVTTAILIHAKGIKESSFPPSYSGSLKGFRPSARALREALRRESCEAPYPFANSFAKESFNAMVRLKTGAPGRESLASATK